MTQLVKYEAARHALQVAHSVDEVKDIRDKAQAMALYAKQANDTALVEWATEIKVRAERRAGEMLAEVGVKPGNPQLSNDTTIGPRLAELGISRDQSSRWQKLAAVPEDQFEQAVAAAKEVAGEVTTAAMLRATRPAPPIEIVPEGTRLHLAERTAKHIDTIKALHKAQAENERLKDELAQLRENLPELTAMASAAEALKNDEHFKKIVHLEAEVAQIKRSRDDFMRENVELKKQVAYWKKRAK